MGQLIRVFSVFGQREEVDHLELTQTKEAFMIFFPLKAAHKKGIVEKIGNSPPPYWFTKPTFMRTKHAVRGEMLGWHLVNTDNWHRTLVKDLTEDQRKLSP